MKIKGVGDLKIKKNKMKLKKNFNLKNDNSKNVSMTFSGAIVDSVWSVHFQIVPWPSLYFSRSIGPFLYS